MNSSVELRTRVCNSVLIFLPLRWTYRFAHDAHAPLTQGYRSGLAAAFLVPTAPISI